MKRPKRRLRSEPALPGKITAAPASLNLERSDDDDDDDVDDNDSGEFENHNGSNKKLKLGNKFHKCIGCKEWKDDILFLNHNPAKGVTGKCFLCRRIEAVEDYVKVMPNKKASLPQQLTHLDHQQEFCKKFKKTLSNYGIRVPTKYLDEAMTAVMSRPELELGVRNNPNANIFRGNAAQISDVSAPDSCASSNTIGSYSPSATAANAAESSAPTFGVVPSTVPSATSNMAPVSAIEPTSSICASLVTSPVPAPTSAVRSTIVRSGLPIQGSSIAAESGAASTSTNATASTLSGLLISNNVTSGPSSTVDNDPVPASVTSSSIDAVGLVAPIAPMYSSNDAARAAQTCSFPSTYTATNVVAPAQPGSELASTSADPGDGVRTDASLCSTENVDPAPNSSSGSIDTGIPISAASNAIVVAPVAAPRHRTDLGLNSSESSHAESNPISNTDSVTESVTTLALTSTGDFLSRSTNNSFVRTASCLDHANTAQPTPANLAHPTVCVPSRVSLSAESPGDWNSFTGPTDAPLPGSNFTASYALPKPVNATMSENPSSYLPRATPSAGYDIHHNLRSEFITLADALRYAADALERATTLPEFELLSFYGDALRPPFAVYGVKDWAHYLTNWMRWAPSHQGLSNEDKAALDAYICRLRQYLGR